MLAPLRGIAPAAADSGADTGTRAGHGTRVPWPHVTGWTGDEASHEGASVLVVEPSKIVREGIRSALAERGAARVVAEAVSGADAVTAARRHRPQIVLLDADLPDRSFADVCTSILGEGAATAVVVLATTNREAAVRTALDAGARAYLLKDSEDLDLPRAIERVLAGERVVDPAAAAALLESPPDQPRLTTQELNVLRLVAEGLTNPEIGERLYLSRHTVKEYVSHAMHKLEATNRVEAVRKAGALGLIEDVVPAAAADRDPPRSTLVYNDTGRPAGASELKVPPLKLDRLEPVDPSEPGQSR